MLDRDKNKKTKPMLFCRVATYRREHAITQQKLCKEVGIARQTLVSMENEQRWPSLLIAMKIAKYFNVPVETLFFYRK